MCVFGHHTPRPSYTQRPSYTRRPEYAENDWNFLKWPKFPIISVVSVRFKQWFRTFSLACFAKIFVTFLDFRKGSPVGKKGWHENQTVISDQNFRFRPSIFTKIHRSRRTTADQELLTLIAPLAQLGRFEVAADFFPCLCITISFSYSSPCTGYRKP